MTHNENIEDILYLHIFIIKEEEFVFIWPLFQNNTKKILRTMQT